ncbi:protein-L-isoaspartate(D-aspartate) O-methyltransferase [Streptomyces sp. NBC_00448]|uniref:protein-L-isoaspartate(D-aspartate) O-methyltransferase n=1 Tax=Streptomyces sp. NBC_00448 TaxID=2903652 RepID=UPI002E1A2394
MSRPDHQATRTLRAALAQQLADDGSLRSPEWRRAVEETPRHLYVPVFYRQVKGAWDPVTAESPGYFDAVYGNEALTTQVVNGRATSSSSQPGLMLEMLEALGIEDGDRVGEGATGTGYNGGLICHRVGDRNFITIEIDARLSRLAEKRLRADGYSPRVVAGDARKGFPDNPMLDRLIVTCGFDVFPYALARGVKHGGVVVCPLGWGNARLVMGAGGVLNGRFLAHGSYFMKARDEGGSGSVAYPRDAGPFTGRTAGIDHNVLDVEMFRFVQSLVLGEFGEATELDDDGNSVRYRVWTGDGSVARVEGAKVRQAGPRKLWDTLELAHAWYEKHGHPSRDRFGATITRDRQSYWLDEPGSPLPACVRSE